MLHVIYNRPKREKSPGDKRYAMLYVGKGEKKSLHLQNHCRQIKSLKTLTMEILRAHLVSHSWVNCLDFNYQPLDPLSNGWSFVNGALQPL